MQYYELYCDLRSSYIPQCMFCPTARWQVKLMHHDVESFRGKVHHYYNGTWGILCDEGWNFQSATVVCKQLGLGNAIWNYTSYANYSRMKDFLWTKTNCTGDEQFLKDCTVTGKLWTISKTCSGQNVAEIWCEGMVNLIITIIVQCDTAQVPSFLAQYST